MQLQVRYWLDPAHPRRADALECLNRRFNRNVVEEAGGVIVIGSEAYPPHDVHRREEIYGYMAASLNADMERFFRADYATHGGITAMVQPDTHPQAA